MDPELRRRFRSLDERVFKVSPSPEAIRLAEKYGYLGYMVERYIRLLGLEEAVELLEWNEKPLPETIRCNDFLITCRELVERLESKGFKLGILPYAPHGFVVEESPYSVGSTHEYLRGYYYIQDPASMVPAYLLQPMPGELIVDMAAAPGGKATQIQQLSRDSSLLIAVDRSRRRIRALRSHLQRMGFRNYIILRMDSRLLPSLGITADKVLLDAPSSGEGIIRKDPGRKRSRGIEDLVDIHYTQLELLAAASRIVGEGGMIVYAACSTAIEEGELVIHKILELDDSLRVSPEYSVGSRGVDEYNGVRLASEVRGCIRMWPQRHGTEGFFICVLEKR